MNSIPEKFKSAFWDTAFEQLDNEKNKLFIISRLYCYGGMEGIYWVEHFYSDKDISLIILDVMMPKINGYKICRLLKFDNKYKDIPIIMVTARSQDEDKLIGEETGADEYVTKPFEFSDVLDKINKYLG